MTEHIWALLGLLVAALVAVTSVVLVVRSWRGLWLDLPIEVDCQDPYCPCEGDWTWHRDAEGEHE